jgi:hypothetical protein
MAACGDCAAARGQPGGEAAEDDGRHDEIRDPRKRNPFHVSCRPGHDLGEDGVPAVDLGCDVSEIARGRVTIREACAAEFRKRRISGELGGVTRAVMMTSCGCYYLQAFVTR